jgi:putative endonuclease
LANLAERPLETIRPTDRANPDCQLRSEQTSIHVATSSQNLPVTPGLTRVPLVLDQVMAKGGWVYIMADRYRGAMYVGVTAHLAVRIVQHRSGKGSDFCRRYGLTRLVWAERGNAIEDCIAHEKRIKRWRREWKFAVIEKGNPDWVDLFDTLA